MEQIRRTQPPLPPQNEEQMQRMGMTPVEVEEQMRRGQQWYVLGSGRASVAHVSVRSEAVQSAVDSLWRKLMVQEPLEISNPHPFIALLGPIKGHRIFSRVVRHFDHARNLTMVILLLACFPQLDVVRNAASPTLTTLALMSSQEVAARVQREKEFESFSNNVINIMIGVINQHDLKMIAGMVNLCLERWDMRTVMYTRVSRPGRRSEISSDSCSSPDSP